MLWNRKCIIKTLENHTFSLKKKTKNNFFFTQSNYSVDNDELLELELMNRRENISENTIL